MLVQSLEKLLGVSLMLLSVAAWSGVEVEIEFAQNITQFTDGQIKAKHLQDQFDCGERIYGVFRINNLDNGERRIITQWKSPGGKIERTNKRKIHISSPDQLVFLSAFIEIVNANSLSAIIDPASGFEPYIGRWTVDVIVDETRIDSGHFRVLC